MEIIEQISAAEKRTRGCLKTEMNDARIVLTPEDYELLVAEFEKETNQRRKWVIACIIINYHEDAEMFFHTHRGVDEYGNDIFIENPE